MKHFIIIISLLALAPFSFAQQSGLQEVLEMVKQNNKALQAGEAETNSLKLQSASENNLPDPTVTYSHLWGNKPGMGFTGEFIASQAFDFPSLYVQRGKLNKVRYTTYDFQHAVLRQQILLQAKQVYLDLVYLNQVRNLLQLRLSNAEDLSRFYESRLEKGDANIIETNKIELELLNVRNEFRQNEAARVAKLEELAALNGGQSLSVSDTVYISNETYPTDFQSFCAEAMDELPELQALRQEQIAANRKISVSKQQWLPGLTLGYRMNPSSGGSRYNGVLVGITIPLFANRHKVQQAKAERFYADNMLDNVSETTEANLRQLWNKASELKKSIDEYSNILSRQNNISLLNKAIQSGQISMIEYFVNITTLYQSMQNYLQLQNDYHKTMAELYKFRID